MFAAHKPLRAAAAGQVTGRLWGAAEGLLGLTTDATVDGIRAALFLVAAISTLAAGVVAASVPLLAAENTAAAAGAPLTARLAVVAGRAASFTWSVRGVAHEMTVLGTEVL